MIDKKETTAYHDKVLANIIFEHDRVDYHVKQAEQLKKIYLLTKNERGIYRIINKLALRGNKYHCKKGTDIALKALSVCEDEFSYLVNYIERQKNES